MLCCAGLIMGAERFGGVSKQQRSGCSVAGKVRACTSNTGRRVPACAHA